ncbi:MAG: hypothetical protein ACR2MT_18700 [Aurantibacter sp.]
MKTNSFNRFAGWSAIISALLFGLSIFGMLQYLEGDLGKVPSFLQNMTDNKGMMLLYGWPGLTATILMLPLFYSAHLRNSSRIHISKSIFLMSLIGIVFVLIGYLFHLAFTYFHTPIYKTLDTVRQSAFDAVFQTNVGIQDMFWLSGDLFAFLGISLLVILNWKEANTPKWLIVWVAISGFAAALGSFSFIPAYKNNMALGLMFLIGFSLYAIWQIFMGIHLIRSKKTIGDTQLSN